MTAGTPIDRFMFGNPRALTAEEQEGLEIFQGRGNCSHCHRGPNFTDEELHNTGVAFLDFTPTDMGGGSADFKTPTLREVARTAPYMHDGSLATLEDVVNFYSDGGVPNPALDGHIRPLHLSALQKKAVVAFLRTLSGTVVEEHVMSSVWNTVGASRPVPWEIGLQSFSAKFARVRFKPFGITALVQFMSGEGESLQRGIGFIRVEFGAIDLQEDDGSREANAFVAVEKKMIPHEPERVGGSRGSREFWA